MSDAVSDKRAELPASGFVLLALLTFFWGINWPAMKIVLAEFPIWWFRSSCLIAGGAGLLLVTRLSGHSISLQRREFGPMLLCSVFGIVGWHLNSAYGLSLMPAGRASIIAFTMPLWAALLSCWILGEALTVNKIAGLALGLTALGILMGSDIDVLNSAPVGAMFMVFAAISWGLGTVLFKKFDWISPVSTLIGWQLLAGAVPVTIGALLLEPFPDVSNASTSALMWLAYVYLFPMLFCQWAFFKTVRLFPASIAAIGTLLIPVAGVFSSALILGENVGLTEVAALLLICMALFVVMVVPAFRRASS